MKKVQLTHGSLFSGFGAPDLAAEWMGWRNAFHCEINEFCITILNYWFPDAEHYSDITRTDFTPWRGRVDVLTGGFPCQPFSVAGQRKGADDNRYLWPQMLRSIREIRPTWVVGENVGGILTMVQPGKEADVESGSSLFGEDYKESVCREEYVTETICKDLEREGYSVQPVLIPACAVGAPHRRDRVWFIAHRSDSGAEAVQQGGKDGVYSVGDVADTNEYRYSPFIQSERIKGIGGRFIPQSDKWGDKTQWAYGLSGFPRITTDTQCNGGGQIHEDLQSKQPERKGVDGISVERDVADTNLQGFSAFGFSEIPKKERREDADRCTFQSAYNDGKLLRKESWRNFPTQSPVCSGDDGLPPLLDRTTVLKGRKSSKRTDTFNAWREESVKGYGNAIVPQVIYEIFKAIEATYFNE